VTTGTALHDIKSAAVTALRASSALAGVTIDYSEPRDATKLKSGSANEAMWLLAGFDAEDEYPTMTAGGVNKDETLRFSLVTQVAMPASDATQDDVDARMVQLLGAAEKVLTNDPGLGLANVHWVLMRSKEGFGGPLDKQGYFLLVRAEIECFTRITHT
jgi:hypothetical protein